MILGKSEFHLSIFRIAPGIDSGDVIDTRIFRLSKTDDIKTSYYKSMLLHVEMLAQNIPSGRISTKKATPQAGTAHYLPQRVPEDGAIDVDPALTVIGWDPVTTDLNGAAVVIVGYQVIVEEDIEPTFPEGFAQPVFSIYLPASATSVEVPREFMRAGTDYAYEVLAIEESGNQTLSSAAFTTR